MIRVRSVITGVEGTPWVSNMYFDPGNTGGDEQAAVDSVGEFWAAHNASVRTACVLNTEPEVPTIDPATGEVTAVVTTDPFTLDFTATGEALPAATQFLHRWTTNNFVGGRRIRGRTFIPGVTEDVNTAQGKPNAGMFTAGTTAANALLSSPAVFCLWSRKNGIAALVTGFSMWDQWAVLRSRRD